MGATTAPREPKSRITDSQGYSASLDLFKHVFSGHTSDGERIGRELFGMCKSVDVWQQQALI